MNTFKRILAAGFALACAVPTAAQAGGAGYFVVAGAYVRSHGPEAEANTARVLLAARRCDVHNIATISSENLVGMRPGRTVQIVGTVFKDRRAAELVLNHVKLCIKDAYIKESVLVRAATDDDEE